MREVILVRLGEIFLKGQNRHFFIQKLLNRINKAVAGHGGHSRFVDARIYVEGLDNPRQHINSVARIFGIHSVCVAVEMNKDNFSAICEKSVEMFAYKEGTFKVQARRSDKTYPYHSSQINAIIGEVMLRRLPDLSVDVHHPTDTLYIEIRDKCYLYTDVIKAVGGMPSGTNGCAALLLSGGIDSPVAGYMIAKRGVTLKCVYFHSPPFTGERAKEKVITLAGKLADYCGQLTLYIVPFTEIQTTIHQQCKEDYTTLIMRRFMMRVAEIIARNDHANALITGESIGQVASQTMEALSVTDSVVSLPVFRPLIGFDKQEIIDIARKIDTFETSSLPYEDCCTVFTPRHPVIRPRADRVEAAESKLDIASLIHNAVQNTEKTVIGG